MRNRNSRQRNGSVFIEVLCGMFILIPIALIGLDLIVLVLANSANDTLAKNCARAAANAKNSGDAMNAAVQIVMDYKSSPFVDKVGFDTTKFVYNDNKGAVWCETVMVVRIPIQLPGTQAITIFHAKASQPVVGVSVAPV